MLTHFLCFHTECPYFCVGSGLLLYVLLFNAFLFCYRPRDAKSNKPYQFLYCVCVYGLYHRCLCGGMVLSCILEEVCGHTVISSVPISAGDCRSKKSQSLQHQGERGYFSSSWNLLL